MIKLVIFDWNATLLADTALTLSASNHSFTTLGKKAITLGQYQDTFKIPIVDFYEAHGFDREYILENMDYIAALFHDYYEPQSNTCRLRKHARKTLEHLSKNNIQSIILSNHTSESIKKHIARLRIQEHIAEILANGHVNSSLNIKNKEQKAEYYLKRKNIKPSETIIVGDSTEEPEIGRALGAISVALTGGNVSTARIKKENPDYIIPSLSGLADIIKKH